MGQKKRRKVTTSEWRNDETRCIYISVPEIEPAGQNKQRGFYERSDGKEGERKGNAEPKCVVVVLEMRPPRPRNVRCDKG